MEVRSLEKKDLEKLFSYNHKIFPERQLCFKDYISFWLSKSEQEIKNCVVLLDDNNTIRGEMLSSTMKYYYYGETYESSWNFDLIVDEDLRKDGWGLDILLYKEQLSPTSFASAVAPTALKIELKQGNSYLGYIQKYIKLINPLWLCNAVLNGVKPLAVYPPKVKIKQTSFSLLTKDQLPTITNSFNKQLWEPVRDLSFLSWRYFGGLHEYAFYKDGDSDDYFVLRTIKYKHITTALLVDFRCDICQQKKLQLILSAAEKVVNKLHVPFLITGSTLSSLDNILNQKHYIKVGHEGHIIGVIDVKDRKQDIDARNFVFVTMADSDCETDL